MIKYGNFSDFTPYQEGATVEDDSFFSIPEAGFADRKVSKRLTTEERACSTLDSMY